MPLLRRVIPTTKEPATTQDSERGKPYLLREHTARRLVAEKIGRPLVSIIAVGAVLLLLLVAIAPWHGGTRIPISISLTVVGVGIGLLIAGFVPRIERLTVDVETRECRLERVYLLGRRTRTYRIPLDDVREVRCRRRVWEDAPDAAVVRWSVELVGDGRTLPLAEGGSETEMQELARLVAEVAGVPRS